MKKKLTAKRATYIRRLYAGNRWTMAELAEKFRVSVSTISNVINGKIYPEETKPTNWQKFVPSSHACPIEVQLFMQANLLVREFPAKQD